jgi:hypothetical protein
LLRQELPDSGAVVICDVEGAEDTLLRPDDVPQLSNSVVLVEVHEAYRPGLLSQLIDRFAATHDHTVVEPVNRDSIFWKHVASGGGDADAESGQLESAVDIREACLHAMALVDTRPFGTGGIN